MSASLQVARSLDDALGELAQGARVVAGGTDLVVGARQGKSPLPERLVAIHRLEELRRSNQAAGALRLGALVTHAQLAADQQVRAKLTALADACAIVGSRATRAHGTLGGNLMNASPAMETGGPLLCFGAGVTLRCAKGSRTTDIAGLLTGPGQTSAAPEELLETIEVPLPPDHSGSAYVRLEYRRQMEIAVVGATAVLTFEGERVAGARLAITALAPTIRRVEEAELALVGSCCDRQATQLAAEAIAAAAKPISDVRASAEYRRAMAAVIGRRAIEVAAARARGERVPVPASPAIHGGLG